MAEPTLSEVRAEMRTGFKHDERIRALEVQQAGTNATMMAVQAELVALRADGKEDKAELLAAIRESKPDSPWKAVAAVAAIVSLVVTVVLGLVSLIFNVLPG